MRPDLALQRLHLDAGDITDVIITHPHYDQIGGLDLFKKATVWMQQGDYEYFVGGAWQQGAFNRGLDKQDVLKIVQVNLDGRLRLVRGDSVEILPGIRVFTGAKHTYASQHLLVNTLATIPILLWITQGHAEHAATVAKAPPGALQKQLAQAARNPSYLLLNAGFFTCGFHVAFIATHLPGVVASCELPPAVSAWLLAVIGLFNIFGSLWIGRVITHRRMKMSLSALYLSRALIIVAFFFAPKTALTFLVFAAAIGFTYLSTVPPTVRGW